MTAPARSLCGAKMNSFPWQRAAVILNRGSGTVTRIGADVLSDGLSSIFAEAKIEATVRAVDGDQIPDALDAAIASNADVVIAGGGDGTVATAAALLARSDKPLGILPLGTFNLAARDLGIPLDWQEAARALINSRLERIDLIEVNGKPYCCMAVLGFYPALALGRPEYHGNWVVKALKVSFAALRSFTTFPPLDLVLRKADGIDVRQRTRIAVVANNDYEDMFGLIPRRCSLAGGFFTVYVSAHRTHWGLFISFLRWLSGRWRQDREMLAFPASEIEIHVRGRRRVAVMLDGEIEKIPVPFRIKVLPRALTVLVPNRPES
jgi:diacylglycerol kinase family enzyme